MSLMRQCSSERSAVSLNRLGFACGGKQRSPGGRRNAWSDLQRDVRSLNISANGWMGNDMTNRRGRIAQTLASTGLNSWMGSASRARFRPSQYPLGYQSDPTGRPPGIILVLRATSYRAKLKQSKLSKNHFNNILGPSP